MKQYEFPKISVHLRYQKKPQQQKNPKNPSNKTKQKPKHKKNPQKPPKQTKTGGK